MSTAFDLAPTVGNPTSYKLRQRAAQVAKPERVISQPAAIVIALLLDLLMTCVVGFLFHEHIYEQGGWDAAVMALITALMMVSIMKARWAYTIAALMSATRQVAHVGLALILSIGALVVARVFSGENGEALRDWALEWFVVSWAVISLGRVVQARILNSWARAGRLARRAVVVGGGRPAEMLIERLERSDSSALQILGLFDDRDKNRSPEQVGRYRKLGRFEDLEEFCRTERVDLLIIALPTTAEERILQILKMLWVLPCDVRIAAIGSKLKLRARAYTYIGDVPFLPLFDKPMSDLNVAVKAIEDRALAALALLFLSPLLALIALAVKLDSRGPVFFRQQRYGFNNEAIGVYKFRSMYVDQCDHAASKLVTKGDPRVTRVGGFLRRTSLDELPQLINVLKGELSLVGPRPHAMQAKAEGRIYDDVVDGYFARHRVKPGITGWAQVNGWRGETDVVEKIEQRVAHDLYYIENWSALFDLRILIMTPLALFTTKNAY